MEKLRGGFAGPTAAVLSFLGPSQKESPEVERPDPGALNQIGWLVVGAWASTTSAEEAPSDQVVGEC